MGCEDKRCWKPHCRHNLHSMLWLDWRTVRCHISLGSQHQKGLKLWLAITFSNMLIKNTFCDKACVLLVGFQKNQHLLVQKWRQYSTPACHFKLLARQISFSTDRWYPNCYTPSAIGKKKHPNATPKRYFKATPTTYWEGSYQSFTLSA